MKLEKATGQVLPSAKYKLTHLVVDTALRRTERPDTAVTKLQISPVFVNGFKNRFHQWIQQIFLVLIKGKEIFFPVSKFGCTLPPCSGLTIGARGFVVGHGHFCGICPNCWNHFWNYEMYVWCRYAWPHAHGVKMWNFQVFQFRLRPR